MSTPKVIEITRRPEPVAHDTFIDDIRTPSMGRGSDYTDDFLPGSQPGEAVPAFVVVA